MPYSTHLTLRARTQYTLFNAVLPWAFPGLLQGRLIPAGCAVAFDQLVHIPFMYLPIFYSIREFAYGAGMDKSCIEGGLAAWRNNIWEDMTAQWALFVPVQTMNFVLVPPRYRTPLIIGVGFFWVMGLSFFRGDKEKEASNQQTTPREDSFA